MDVVGEYRTMACTVSIAYTPSVTFGDSSPYTGEPFLCPFNLYVDFYCSVIVSWRIGACRRPYNASPEVYIRKKPRYWGFFDNFL